MFALTPKRLRRNQNAILNWLLFRGHFVDYGEDGFEDVHCPPLHCHVGEPCPYCGDPMTKKGRKGVSRDHKHPRSRGGTLEWRNRIICCDDCNAEKSNKTLEVWHAALLKASDPRAERVGWIVYQEFKGRPSTLPRERHAESDSVRNAAAGIRGTL